LSAINFEQVMSPVEVTQTQFRLPVSSCIHFA